MKKIYFTMIAAAMLGMTSCSDEMPALNGAEGQEVTVNYSISLPASIASRAYGEASQVKHLHYAVYAAGTKDVLLQGDEETFFNSALQNTLPLNLVNGKSYDLVFWADAPGQDIYTFDRENQQVSVDYSAVGGNFIEKADAFFATVKNFKVDGTTPETVKMYRPFAQLNIGTDDVALTNPAVTEVSVKVPVYSAFDLFSGDVIGSATEVTFGPSAISAATEDFPVASADPAKPYQYLAMDYLLVNDRELVTVTMTTNDASAEPRVYDNVPVQRNYRTNIYGSLLTSSVNFSIKIEPDFEKPDNDVYIATASEFTAALNTGGNYVLVNDIELGNNVVASAPVSIDLNDHNLDLGAWRFGVYNDVPVTVTNGNINSTLNNVQAGVFDVGSDAFPEKEGKLTLENVTLNSPSSAGIAAHGKSTIVLNNTTIAAKAYCIATNASLPAVQDLDITITGGKYTAFSPIFVNVPCKLKMTDVEVYGEMHGVVARGGTVNISGGKIYMTYDESESDSDADSMAQYFTSRDWGSGNTINLAALTMGNKVADTSTSYRYPTNVTLSGVEVACKGIYASKFPTVYIWANPADGQGVSFNYDANTTFTGGQGVVVGKVDNVTINGIAPSTAGVQ